MKRKLSIFFTLSILLIIIIFTTSCSGGVAPNESKTYTYDDESLTELFYLYFDKDETDDLSVSTFNTTEGHVVIRYTLSDQIEDYGTTLREMFTRYINFSEAAYQVEYLDEVRLFVSAHVPDRYGNLEEEELFSFWLDKEIYESFNWDNMVEEPLYDLIQGYITYPTYGYENLYPADFDFQEELYYMGR